MFAAGYNFEFVDGLPIRKCRRSSPVPALGASNQCQPACNGRPLSDGSLRDPLTFCTPSTQDGNNQPHESPLLQIAHLTQAALLHAVAQETSPALVQVLQRVIEQCPDAIQAASQQKPVSTSATAVEEAAIERVLLQQQCLEKNLEQLQHQEDQVQTLTDDVIGLEQFSQSTRQQLRGSVEEASMATEQPNADLEVREYGRVVHVTQVVLL